MKLILKIIAIISMINCQLFFAFAQTINQEISVTLNQGDISILHTPDNFNFTSSFINSSNFYLYKTLYPDTYNSNLIIEDADTSGKNFNITVAMTNLTDGSNVIPFSNLSIVTLATDPSGVDAFVATTPPANTVDVTAPINCGTWVNDIANECQTDFNNNRFSSPPITINVDPTNYVDSTDTQIYVDDTGLYSVNEIIEFDDGEKALITNNSGGYLDVERGILGTTATTHAIGTGISRFHRDSDQIVIMEGPEPPGGRMGAYSIGFGFQSLIEPILKGGNYTGTLTFTLYIY